jgi:glycerophosphoryl diester phosphodiesterase
LYAVHNQGKQVFVWMVNDAATMFTLAGLITDKPAMARRVLEHRANMPAIGRLILEFAEILGVSPELGEQ